LHPANDQIEYKDGSKALLIYVKPGDLIEYANTNSPKEPA